MEKRGQTLEEHRLNYLYRRISMPIYCFKEWLCVPEFVGRINELLNSGVVIDNKVVLDVGRSILTEKARNRKANKEFHFNILRKGMNHVERALSPSAGKEGG